MDKDFGVLIDGGVTIVQQLGRLIELAEQPIKPRLVLTRLPNEALIILPPDPEGLSEVSVFFLGQAGLVTVQTWRTALGCPGGTITVLPLNIPRGWVTYRRKPLEVSSDFYDTNIGVNVYSDGIPISPVAPMPLTGGFTIDMGEYVTQWVQILIEVINGTVTDAVVTCQVCAFLMDSSLWDEYVLPLMEVFNRKIDALMEGPREGE